MDQKTKESQVAELRDKFTESSVVIFCSYQKLDVPTITSLRRNLEKDHCEYKIYKNSLIKVAVKGTSMESISAILEGPTALIFSREHPATAAKIARDFSKERKDLFYIKGGYLEGNILSNKQVDAVADMPSKEQIKADFLGVLLAPATNLVALLQTASQSFVCLLDAYQRNSETQDK